MWRVSHKSDCIWELDCVESKANYKRTHSQNTCCTSYIFHQGPQPGDTAKVWQLLFLCSLLLLCPLAVSPSP